MKILAKPTRKLLAGTSVGTVMFAALILLSPLTILFPLSNSMLVTTTTYVTFERTATATYTSTAFETSFTTTTGTMPVQIPVGISPQIVGFMAPKGKCSQFKMPLPVKSGTNLNLQLTSTNPANLYLLPTETFQTSADGCSLIGSSILTANNFTSYNLQWTATGDSTVYLLLIGPNTIILVRDHGSTVSVEQLATMIYASTETNPQLYSSIDIANYTATATTTSTSHTYFPPSIPYALSFVAILVMFLGPILLLGSKKGIARLKALKNAVC